MKRPLVDSPIAEKADRTPREALILQSITESQTKRGLARNNAMAPPEVFVGRKEVHRAAFAL